MAGKKKAESNQPAAKKAAGKKADGAIVLVEFRDANDFFKVHHVGDDVSHFDAQRIEKLLSLGYVSGKALAAPDPTEEGKNESDEGAGNTEGSDGGDEGADSEENGGEDEE